MPVLRLYNRKKHLVDEKANERTIASHIAGYMQQALKEWDVDSEYNREGTDRIPKKDVDGKLAYPDIIVHKHGSEGPNLAAAEVKGYWNNTARGEDEMKLKKLQAKTSLSILISSRASRGQCRNY